MGHFSRIVWWVATLLIIAGGVYFYNESAEVVPYVSGLTLSLLPSPARTDQKQEIIQAVSVETPKTITVAIGGDSVIADIVDTVTLRERGLSGRSSLEEGKGMLFVFEVPSSYGFWMKDMKFPIDIIWLDQDKKIVDIRQNLSPKTYPKIYRPKKPALYVLEVPSGFSYAHNLKIGDSTSF